MTSDAPVPGPFARARARLARRGAAGETPAWVTSLDLIGVAFVGLALRVLLFGGFRFRIDGLRVSVGSAWRPLLLAAALVALRHALWRGSPLHRRMADLLRSAWRVESFRAAFGPFLVSRAAVLLVGFVAVSVIGFERPPDWRISEDELLNLPARWDAGWYLSILRDGYSLDPDPTHPSNIAFFPAFPMLMRAAGALTGLPAPAAAYLLVTASFFWALTYLYRLARLDLTAEASRAALLLAVFYPFAVYYSALYTESIFLLAVCGAFYHFRRHHLVRAGLFGLLAGLVRPNGSLLAVPLGLIALIDYARGRGWLGGGEGAIPDVPVRVLVLRLLAAGMPIAGLFAYSAFIYQLTGDPLAWAKVQGAWGRGAGQLALFLAERRDVIARFGIYGYLRDYSVENMNSVAALFALGAAWPVTRRFGLPYGLFIALCVLPPALSAGSESLGRYTSPLFPVFLWLGARVGAATRVYWVAAFAAGEALVAALFFTWRAPF